MKRFKVLDDVTRSIRDDDSIKLVHGLENETNTRAINKRVLLAAIGDELRESGEKALYASSRYINELSRDQS